MYADSHINPNNNYAQIMERTLDNFKRILDEKHLSSFRVAKDLDYSPSYFYNWSKHRSYPTLMALCRIAEYLDVTLIELMGFEITTITEQEKELIRRYNSLDSRKQMDVIAILVNMQNMQEQEDVILRQKQKKYEEKVKNSKKDNPES